MRILPYSLVEAFCLCCAQVTLKKALTSFESASFTWEFISQQLTNFWWPLVGLCYALAGGLWFYILRHFPFSQAYPLSCLAYLLGMLSAVFVFHETVVWTQWLGCVLIMAGCVLVAGI